MNAIGEMVINFAQSHQQWVYGLIVGFMLSNPGKLAILAFNLFVKIPGVGPWIAKNPDKAKAWADGFDQAIDQCIADYAAKNAVQPAAQPPAEPPKP